MSKVSVVLNEQEQQELQMILSDRDDVAALRFLKEVVWAQVQAAHRQGMRSHLDTGQT